MRTDLTHESEDKPDENTFQSNQLLKLPLKVKPIVYYKIIIIGSGIEEELSASDIRESPAINTTPVNSPRGKNEELKKRSSFFPFKNKKS